MKQRLRILTVILCMFLIAGLTVTVWALPTEASLLQESNWTNLAGYTYLNPNAQSPTPLRAEATFSPTAEGTGIKYKGRGYYLSGDTNYAGIVYNEKIDVTNFSITFTINTLGKRVGNDDAWIGIGLMTQKNLWHTVDPSQNMGAVALFRPTSSSREMNTFIHEIGTDGTKKISNFTGSPAALSSTIVNKEGIEGVTLRYSLTKTLSGGAYRYVPKVETINFETGAVIRTFTYNTNLHSPELHIGADEQAYLAISASTNNQNCEWEFTIKNINGVDVGRQSDVLPVPADEKAAEIVALIDSLKLYDHYQPSATDNAVAERKNFEPEFYSPKNEELSIDQDVQTLFNLLTRSLTDDEVLGYLKVQDTNFNLFKGAGYFTQDSDYINFLFSATESMMNEYDTFFALDLIDELEVALLDLPQSSEVSFENEKEMRQKLRHAKSLYNGLSTRAVEILSQRASENGYDSYYKEIVGEYFAPLDEAFTGLSVGRTVEWLDTAEEKLAEIGGAENITMSNVIDFVLLLVPSELIYNGFDAELKDIFDTDYADARLIMETLRTEVDRLKGGSNSDRVKIEGYEDGAELIYEIFFLPNPVLIEDFDEIFEMVATYQQLSTEIKNKISTADKNELGNAAAQVLNLVIAQMPSATQITKDNYVQQGYDESIPALNSRFIMLESFSTQSFALITDANKSKLSAAILKVNVLMTPLSAKQYVVEESYKAGEKISIPLSELFNNPNGIDVVYTASYGEIIGGNWEYTPSKGEVTVTITMKSEEFSQSADNTLVFNVQKKGCGSVTFSNGNESHFWFISIMAALCIFALAGLGLRRVKEYEKN